MLTMLALLALLTLWVVITIVVVALSLAGLAGALALTLGHSRHVGQVSEMAMVSDSFSVPNLDQAERALRSIPADEVWHKMLGQNSPDHQVIGTLDRYLAVKVAEKKDAIVLQDKVEMLAQPSPNDESNGENEGRSGWRERRVFRVYAVFGPSIVDIHKLQEVPKMTIDWFAPWGAERRLAWGRWKMVCCVGWTGRAVGKASAKQALTAVRR